MGRFYTAYILVGLSVFFHTSLFSQSCNTAISVSLPYAVTSQTTCGQADDYNSANMISCGSSVFTSGEDVLYGFTPSTSGYILITFSSTQTQTGIFLYEGCPDNGICISSNTSYSTTNSIGFNASANVYYTLMIDNWSPPTCISSYDLSISAPGKKMPNEQDCNGAIPICTDIYVQPNSYSGTGNVPNELNPASSCLSNGEKNSVWYTIQEQTSGNLSFTINPNSPTDDYDWAVFNITNSGCEDIYSNPSLEISCNSSGTAGSTGPNGQSGNQYNAVIPVQQGDIYVILIINYWPTQSGYTLDFSASTATLYDTIGPQFLSVETLPVCGDSNLTVKFTDNVMCNSISTSDFQLVGPGGTVYTITNVTSDGCDMGGEYDKYYSFAISPAISEYGSFSFIMVDTVVDVCGNVCVFPDTIQFTFDSLQITSSASPSDCQDSSGSITTTVWGGSSPYTYNWLPSGDTTSSLSNVSAGSYIVSISDKNGCMASDTVLVQDKNAASLEISTYQEPSCKGYFSGFLGVSVLSGTPNYSYLWNDPYAQQGSIAQGLSAGYYYVKVTDGSGCNAIADTLLNEPDSIVAGLDDTLTICKNAGALLVVSSSGGTPPYSYSWNNIAIGNTDSALVYPQSTTVYKVSVSDNNGCAASSDSITVTFYDDLLTQISGDTQSCAYDTLSLLAVASGGNSPYTFIWNNSSTDSLIIDTPSATTTYWVSVTDACADTTATDSFTVTILEAPLLDFEANISTGCLPLSVEFALDTSVISGAIYFWEFYDPDSTSGDFQPSHIYNASGTFDVMLTITYSNGCNSTTQKQDYIEVYDSPTAGFSYSPITLTMQNPECNFVDVSQNATSWNWFVDDSLFSILQNPSFSFTSPGTYTVMQVAYNNYGCSDTSIQMIEVIEVVSIQFPTAFSPNGDGLNDIFMPLINGASAEGYSFMIFDRWGASVFNSTDIDQAWNGRINGNKIILGAYSYKIIVRDMQDKEHVYSGIVTLVK